MAQLTAQWQKIGDAQPLQRSSQVVSIVYGHAYVYGGELEPRKPRDNDIQTFAVNEKGMIPLHSGPSSVLALIHPSVLQVKQALFMSSRCPRSARRPRLE